MFKLTKGYRHYVLVSLVTVTTLLNGCTTPGQSVGLGAGIGASAGAIAGGLANPGKDGEYRTRNIIMGTGVGAMTGMVTGSLIHESAEKEKQTAFERGKAAPRKQTSGNMPPLREPRVEAKWVESKIVGNRFVEGHFEYQIVEPAHWENAQ